MWVISVEWFGGVILKCTRKALHSCDESRQKDGERIEKEIWSLKVDKRRYTCLTGSKIKKKQNKRGGHKSQMLDSWKGTSILHTVQRFGACMFNIIIKYTISCPKQEQILSHLFARWSSSIVSVFLQFSFFFTHMCTPQPFDLIDFFPTATA